jgi:hypothetical protein
VGTRGGDGHLDLTNRRSIRMNRPVPIKDRTNPTTAIALA